MGAACSLAGSAGRGYMELNAGDTGKMEGVGSMRCVAAVEAGNTGRAGKQAVAHGGYTNSTANAGVGLVHVVGSWWVADPSSCSCSMPALLVVPVSANR